MYLQWNDVSVSPNFPTTSRRLYDNSPAYLLHFLGHAFRTWYSYFRVTCSEGGDQRLFNASGTLVIRLGVRRPQARGAQTYWKCYHCTNQPRICREQSTFISLEFNSPGFSLTSMDCQRLQHQTIQLRPIYFWKRPFATVKFMKWTASGKGLTLVHHRSLCSVTDGAGLSLFPSGTKRCYFRG